MGDKIIRNVASFIQNANMCMHLLGCQSATHYFLYELNLDTCIDRLEYFQKSEITFSIYEMNALKLGAYCVCTNYGKWKT